MDTQEAIFSRRTIKDFKPDPVPAPLIEHVLIAGTWAQNHKLTEPWRFIVLGPKAHQALAAIDSKLATKPLIVAVTCSVSGDAFQQREDYAAVCCAIQNIQLAAWASGLGMQWSTGRTSQLPETLALLGINPQQEEMAGLLYFGYPALVPASKPRRPLAEVTRWLD